MDASWSVPVKTRFEGFDVIAKLGDKIVLYKIVTLRQTATKTLRILNNRPHFTDNLAEISAKQKDLVRTYLKDKTQLPPFGLNNIYARIFVPRTEGHSIPRTWVPENCPVLINVRGQISVHIFAPSECYCLYCVKTKLN